MKAMTKRMIIIVLTLTMISLLIIGCRGENSNNMTGNNKETRNVNNVKTLRIEWKRLVSDGQTCPRCGSTEEELEKAISSLKQSLVPLGIEVVLEKYELSIEEFEKDPLQSNQIWLNNRSLEDWIGGQVGQSPCCDVCGPSECRTIQIGEAVYEAITADLVIKAGLRAASQLVGTETNESYFGSESPIAPDTGCCPE